MDLDNRVAWMRELFGRLERSNDQAQATSGAARPYLARVIEHDLSELRRLFHSVRRETLAGTIS